MARTRRVKVDGRVWEWKVFGSYFRYRRAGQQRGWRELWVPRTVLGLHQLLPLIPEAIRGRGFRPEQTDQVLRDLVGR